MRISSRLLACVLIAQLAFPTRTVWANEAATDVMPSFSEEASTLRPGQTTGTPEAPYQVSSTGSFDYRYPLSVPPGRAGMAPSLALVYSSAGSQQPSAFGAGWSLPISKISRFFSHGTPRIVRNADGEFRYDDSPTAAPFDRDGVDIIVDQNSPTDSGRSVYRDRIDRSFTKSFFHPEAPTHWLVVDRDGTQRFYGNVTDGTVPEAVHRNELGISDWLLVRTVDPFGNAIDYQYLNETGSAPGLPQLVALPYRIEYGGNVKASLPHFARVEFTYIMSLPGQSAPIGNLLLDLAHGRHFLDRIASRVDVSLLAPGAATVRRYDLDIGRSPSTERYLLKSIQESAGGSVVPAVRFDYSRNDGVVSSLCASDVCTTSSGNFTPSAPLAASLDRNILRHYWDAGVAISTSGVPWAKIFEPEHDLDGHRKWPLEFLSRTSRKERFTSHLGYRMDFGCRILTAMATSTSCTIPTSWPDLAWRNPG